MNGNLPTKLATSGLLLGLMAAIYVSDHATDITSSVPIQNTSLGIAGLVGIAFALVIARFTIGTGRKD